MSASDYCNIVAREIGLDPVGHGRTFADAVFIETPLPWKKRFFDEAGALPQEMIDLNARWKELGDGSHRPLLIAPDEEYSQPGHRRVLYYRRPIVPFAQFERSEFLVPEQETGPLLWTLFEDHNNLANFDPYRVAETESRDIFVCTHGTYDAACGKFGQPLYKHLRQTHAGGVEYSSLRVWRVSHTGGHVFAPTFIDMPTGHYWAYVGEEQADQIVARSGDVSVLSGFYRGWAGLEPGFVQAAEHALWQREGWPWFTYAKTGEVTDCDNKSETPQWANVRIVHQTQTHESRSSSVHVKLSEEITTRASSGTRIKSKSFPQYVATF